MTRPRDPYAGFRFVVEIGGAEIGGFSQVGGLERETVLQEYREGGVNDFVHKLVNHTKYANLRLRRGLVDAAELWAWHQAVILGEVQRMLVAVVVKKRDGSEAWRWVFSDAYPVKWSAGDLDASTNTVVMENLELAHHGMRKL